MRALEFAPLGELEKRYGNLKRLEDMPKDSIAKPAVVFKPVDLKKQVVPWDSNRALELWRKRQPHKGEVLPDIFTKISDVTQTSEDIIGRNRLVLKARNTKELMYYTTDDE
jgi:anaerobic dimethyl sulfoxide reductase subunit B (iron-sulfur subunit)